LKIKQRYERGSRSYIMSRIGPKDTFPEMKVRRFLFSHGFRYRIHYSSLPGRPDIVLTKLKVAIFVNGCYWHNHGCDATKGLPKTNSDFWIRKFERNKVRDYLKENRLREMGWEVITIWECEINDAFLFSICDRLKHLRTRVC